MKLVSYKPEMKEQWNTFVRSAKNGLFMFERDFMDYHSDRFHDHSLMLIDDAEKLLAVLPANVKGDTLYSHQGLTFGSFVTNTAMRTSTMLDAFSMLKTHMIENGLKALIYKAIPHIYHRQPAQEDLYALYRMNAQLIRVDVTTTVNMKDRISFSDLRKRGAKKATKAGVVFAESRDYSAYMALLGQTLAERHEAKPVHSADEINLLASRFPERIRLFVATKDAEMLAGTIVFEYDQLVHAQYIAASSAGRELGALDLVFVELIENVFKNKLYFDFGISTEDAGRTLNSGLINQKEGFGGRAVCHQFYEMRTD